jgi:UDPglucose 6-dehydrogenase
MHIAVVGSGYVGLVTGTCFADLGHDVMLVDNDEQRLADLRSGDVPIHERFLPELLARHRGKRIEFSGDLQAAVRECDAIFIAVGTPATDSGEADLSYVESVAREIAGAVDSYKVVVEKSTVPVYTSQWIRTVVIRNGATPASFDIASNPEFLREGTAVTDFLYPDRIVVGVESERCAEVLREIYLPLTSGAYYNRPDAIPRPDRAQVPPLVLVDTNDFVEQPKVIAGFFRHRPEGHQILGKT